MPSHVVRGALVGLVLLVLGAGPAAAHASLTGSDPEDGSSLDAAPTAVSLEFNENVASPAYVVVTAPDGTAVAVDDVTAVDAEVTARLAGVDQRGTYTLSYRVVSADGHPVKGSIRYDVTTGRTVTQVEAPKERGFVHRHRGHFFWGILAAAVAIALLLAPLRRRSDPHDA